jgi:hypothetical protein
LVVIGDHHFGEGRYEQSERLIAQAGGSIAFRFHART